MTHNRLAKLCKKFLADKSAETAIQTTLIFSFAVMVGVIVGVPMLNSTAKEYAYQKQYGVDPVQTSSVGEVKPSVKRYTIRKSILDNDE